MSGNSDVGFDAFWDEWTSRFGDPVTRQVEEYAGPGQRTSDPVSEARQYVEEFGRLTDPAAFSSIEESRTAEQMRTRVLERASAQPAGEGRLKVCLIDEGQGSSGFYPASTLRAAAPMFKAGTHCYLDHPTESEEWQRPERAVRDLAGVLASDAVFRDGGLYADVRVFSSHRELIKDAAPYIGMSIRAEAEVSESVLPSGRRGLVVESITSVQSVDFVTRAGRGGRIESVS